MPSKSWSAAALKRARLRLGLTQAELGAYFNISQRTISEYENPRKSGQISQVILARIMHNARKVKV